MSYEWEEHTAELELHVEAPTEVGVFGDALRALAELLSDGAGGPAVTREIAIREPERAALLAQWIEELVYLAETEDLIAERVTELELTPAGLVASISARRAKPRHLVKAATYHRLRFEPSADGFRATVVLDV